MSGCSTICTFMIVSGRIEASPSMVLRHVFPSWITILSICTWTSIRRQGWLSYRRLVGRWCLAKSGCWGRHSKRQSCYRPKCFGERSKLFRTAFLPNKNHGIRLFKKKLRRKSMTRNWKTPKKPTKASWCHIPNKLCITTRSSTLCTPSNSTLRRTTGFQSGWATLRTPLPELLRFTNKLKKLFDMNHLSNVCLFCYKLSRSWEYCSYSYFTCLSSHATSIRYFFLRPRIW